MGGSGVRESAAVGESTEEGEGEGKGVGPEGVVASGKVTERSTWGKEGNVIEMYDQ